MNLVIVKESQKIIDGVYTTGRLNGTPVDEQSLVLKGKKYWYVLAGCSHSGVKEILGASMEHGNIVGLIGGLHDFNNFYILGALELVCATHCTKHKKEIQRSYSEISVEGGVGRIIEI